MNNVPKLPSPLDLIYERLAYVMEPYMPPMFDYQGACDNCGRLASQHGARAGIYNSYHKDIHLCRSCLALHTGDVEFSGVERITSRGAPVSVRLAHLLSGGLLIEATPGGRATLLIPEGTNKLMAKPMRAALDVVICPPSERVSFLARQKLSFPLLYVHQFGVKTNHLTRGLAYSYSERAIVMCSDAPGGPANLAQQTLDLTAAQSIARLAGSFPQSAFRDLKTMVGATAFGHPQKPPQSPSEVAQALEKSSELAALHGELPKDPYVRITTVLAAAQLLGEKHK